MLQSAAKRCISSTCPEQISQKLLVMKPSQDGHNLEKTGYDCALCEKPNHADDNMVLCERCQKWFHFMCVGVTTEIEKLAWSCDDCRNATGKICSQVDGGTVHEVSDSTEKNEEGDTNSKTSVDEDEEAERQHQKELLLMKQRFERQFQREKEKMMMQIRLEREMLERKKNVEAEVLKMRSELYAQFHCSIDPLDQEKGAAGGKFGPGQEHIEADLEKEWREKLKFPSEQVKPIADPRGAFPKCSTPKDVQTQPGTVHQESAENGVVSEPTTILHIRTIRHRPNKLALI